ncbi:hypothetical protein [Paraglaciecola sp.]|uniref:hypothetical protein n=1 Tax=Paraglaciecola sp. TaxID=1920173 RepID=UPI003EF40BBA
MFDPQLWSVLLLGMMVGIFHAFDADHVVAMATLVSQKSKKKHILKYACKWGGGHGGVLLLLGGLLVFVGVELPSWFVHYAEMMVGVLLIYLGIRLWLFVSKIRNNQDVKQQKHDHAPLFIGMLHGVAGSAPVLALLPNMLESQFLLHVILFSLGCLFGMFCFGFALGSLQAYVKQMNTGLSHLFTRLLSVLSMGLGTFWIFS